MKNTRSSVRSRTSSIAILAPLLLTAIILAGCSAPWQVTQPVRDVKVDTVYLSNTQYDSIYSYHDRVQTDTILLSPTNGETEEIERPLTWFDYLCRICFGICLSGFLILILCITKGLRSMR